MVMSVLVVVSVGILYADEFTWTGAAGDNDWSNSANWGGTAPGDTDTAIFSKAATVTPPVDFAGVLQVKGAVKVTVNISGATRFKLLMDNVGGTLEKGGSGELTLSVAYGILRGQVIAAAGKLLLAGNGDDAPGAFDSLTVKAGASAEVVESPIETCHGAVYRVGGCAAGATYAADKLESFYKSSTFAKFLAGWPIDSDKYIDVTATRTTGIYVPDEGEVALDGAKGYPEGFQNYTTSSGDLVLLFRAIVLNETEVNRTSYVVLGKTNGKGTFSCFYNGTKVYNRWPDGSTYRGEPITTQSSKGWCAMDLLLNSTFDQWRSDSYPYYTCTPVVEGGHEKLTRNVLWCGVCFNAVTVEEGASLTVTDGQALAISNARGFKMAGAFSGATANTYLYLGSDWSVASGDEKLSAKALRDFPGTLEIAPTSCLGDDPEAKTDVPYDVIGTGELTITEANKTKIAGFAGSVAVGENVSYEISGEGEPRALTEKSALQPVSSETWAFFQDATLLAGGEVRFLNRASGKGQWDKVTQRAALVGKVGVPVYCPFELSCDLCITGWQAQQFQQSDPSFALTVHAAGPSMTFAAKNSNQIAYMLPSTSIAFGFAFSCWSQNFMWITDSATAATCTESLGEKSWRCDLNKAMKYTLAYDGFGTFTATIVDSTGVKTHVRRYSVLADSKYTETRLYPSISARAEFGSYGVFSVSNVVFKTLSAPAALAKVKEVMANGSLTVKVGQVDAEVGTPALGLAGLTMGAGATLNCAPYFSGLVSGVSLDGLMVKDGAATVVPAANESLATTVGDFTSRNGGKLTVTGPVTVKTPLTVSVSRSELKAVKGPMAVLDVSGASPVPSIDLSNVTLNDLDESGKRIGLEYVNGILKANAAWGLFFIVK